LEAGTLEVHANDGSIQDSDALRQNLHREDLGWKHHADGRSRGQASPPKQATARFDASHRRRPRRCHTSDGSIHIDYAPDAPKAPTVTATTSDAAIIFIAPPGLSATIDAATDDGSIHTSLPITVAGKVGKSLTGKVGDGEGKIHLRTRDGSITIR
jgi:hypothetical protein